MTAIQARAADAFVRRPDAHFVVVLAYGPDAGLVSERVKALVAASVDDPADPFQLVRLDGDDLAADPGRLIDEVATVPLFGGRRAVWVRAGRGNLAPALAPVLDTPPRDCRVVVEGGDWKKSAPAVALVERSRAGAVLACYGDEAVSIGQIIAEEVAAAGLAIAPEAREALIALLGGDRLASRGEVQKLCLYAAAAGRIELADVEAVVGDASAFAADAVVDAAFGGRAAALERALGKAWTEGVDAGVLAGTALRHALLLHRLRGEVERGRAPASVVEGAGHLVHFRRRQEVTAQLGGLAPGAIDPVVADLQAGVLAARRNSVLGRALVGRTLMRIALQARSRGRGR